MTADRRAALKRKIMSLITDTWDGERTIENASTAAIDLIRAEVLEEAARVADATKAFDDNLQQSAGCWTTGQRIAAAIRALKGDT